ncbi:MAG: NYN domain-containing protein [Lachnospiraceae bacterium]
MNEFDGYKGVVGKMSIKSEKIIMGILAHVDAGKTTLAESILYRSGEIRKLGRVDHQNAFLDTYQLERDRGITIFSKQAEVKIGEKKMTLLDTPGHVDFSAEMERTLMVLDYAILVISGADGVQGHVETLWKLLKQYEIPVFLFINKMDQEGTDREALLSELKEKLDENCVLFGSEQDEDEFYENISVCGEEDLLEQYLETGEIEKSQIRKMIARREIFPCFFGSALKLIGVDEFLEGIEDYTIAKKYSEEFGAKIYKISRDEKGTRLTHMKITGGSLKAKMLLKGEEKEKLENAQWEEKVDQLRVYSGASFVQAKDVKAGEICAVTGLSKTYSGEGLGIEKAARKPTLDPVLTYRINLPEGCDVQHSFLKLRQLEEEEPQMHIVWQEETNEIHAQIMGEVQIEVMQSLILDRFGIEVSFDSGSIVYKETIGNRVEGVGHFEPLRHYAEVHLLLEPLPAGSGLIFGIDCSEDLLDKNWQRLILTHLLEKKHLGVLTGSEITDMKITLVSGRAHQKHTEGGDFRQATYRAVRQGLKSAESILLEPVYRFRLEVPSENVGRAMNDIQKMKGEFSQPELQGDMSIITGTAPVVLMQDYQREVISYTRGRGKIFCSLNGYEPCHNAEEVIAKRGYDSELDVDNPTGSVFCSHGAGFVVPWDEVPNYMHLGSAIREEKENEEELTVLSYEEPKRGNISGYQMDKELEEIFNRTYGGTKKSSENQSRNMWRRQKNTDSVVHNADYNKRTNRKNTEKREEYLLVDGYNIIFAWEDLSDLARVDLAAARGKLMDILSNYQGWKQMKLILVFDAYKVEGNIGSVSKYHNIYVVYTKEAETADQYIEKTVHEIGKKYNVTVATSDALEQMIIMGAGATRLSARNLREEIENASIEIRTEISRNRDEKKASNYLFEGVSKDLAELIEDIRLQRNKNMK